MTGARLKAEGSGSPSSHAIGRSHHPGMYYNERMDAVNYALNHDDGGVTLRF